VALGLLLDTHVAIRWLVQPKRLSHDQLHALREATRRHEQVWISAISLLEIAVLFSAGRHRLPTTVGVVFKELTSNPTLQVLPLTFEIAYEIAAIGGGLRDPADRAIVATARVHHLRLLTSDQRIIASNLVPVIA
jgi:PIN domain nuclease of toxin-antitoxin system